MNALLNTLLPIHVAAGGLALVLGAVALLARKGGTAHRRSGLLFAYVMLVMGASASILFHSSALSWSFSAAMFSSRCASDDVPGSRSIIRFQLLRSFLTSASVTPASARYARFHYTLLTCRIAT